jgi:hypothetical protein
MPDFSSFPQIPQMPQIPKINLISPQMPDLSEAVQAMQETRMADHGYAHILYERLIKQIQDFEADLDSNEEIAAYLSSFGTTLLIQIEDIGYQNPFFIIFYGYTVNDRQKVKLVQHTTQLNVLFTSVKLRPEESRQARRIGFHTGKENQ